MFCTYCGLTARTLRKRQASKARDMHKQVLALIDECKRADDNTMVVMDSHYLETVTVR